MMSARITRTAFAFSVCSESIAEGGIVFSRRGSGVTLAHGVDFDNPPNFRKSFDEPNSPVSRCRLPRGGHPNARATPNVCWSRVLGVDAVRSNGLRTNGRQGRLLARFHSARAACALVCGARRRLFPGGGA